MAYLYGNSFAFQDTSNLRYIGMQRHFNSSRGAAAKASIAGHITASITAPVWKRAPHRV